MKESTMNVVITIIIAVAITTFAILSWSARYKKINNEKCKLVTFNDLFYIERKAFVSCHGDCNIDYSQTVANAFTLYGSEFALYYCGEDSQYMPSVRGE